MDIEWQDERGDVLAQYDGPLMEDLLDHAPGNSVCLRFIDPYSDTTFNQWQVSVLIAELEALEFSIPPTLREIARAVRKFVAQAQGATHTYIKFLGD